MLRKDQQGLRNLIFVALAGIGLALMIGMTCVGRSPPPLVESEKSVETTAGGIKVGTTELTYAPVERERADAAASVDPEDQSSNENP